MLNTKNNQLIWEIPKGRKEYKETDMDCAIREFKEEASIGINNYSILFNINPIIECYISDKCTYKNTYFIAYTHRNINTSLGFDCKNILSEIDSIRWVNLNETKYLDKRGYLHAAVNSIFNVLKNKYHFLKQ